jgi:aryl-alcohol dehydrogenase-like predicted oxidoreductase
MMGGWQLDAKKRRRAVRYQPLSDLNPAVSVLGLGTGPYGSELCEDSCAELLDRFAGAGGNFIDTAHIYGAWAPGGVNGGCGNSETVIGRWMRARGCRDRMVIGTKGGHPDFETGAGGLSRETLLRHLHESLDHLQTDYIDFYWLHRDDRTVPVDEILGWLEEPLAQGLIRAVGTSHWRVDRMEQAGTRICANQIAWSLAQPAERVTSNLHGEQLAMDEPLFEFHRRSGMPVAAFNSQASGFFSSRYDAGDFSAKPQLAAKFGSEQNLRNRRTAGELAGEKGCSANQIALAWLLHQPVAVFPLIGPRTVEQLDDSLGAPAIRLSAEELLRFDFQL